MPGERRHPDERALGLHQVGHGVLDAQHRAEHVQVEHADELVGVLQVVRRHATPAAGVGDEPAQPAEALDVGRDERGDVVLHRHVGDDGLHVAVDRGGDVGEARLGAPGDRHGRAVGGEAPGAGCTDAGAAAGDDDALALQPAHGCPPRLQMTIVLTLDIVTDGSGKGWRRRRDRRRLVGERPNDSVGVTDVPSRHWCSRAHAGAVTRQAPPAAPGRLLHGDGLVPGRRAMDRSSGLHTPAARCAGSPGQRLHVRRRPGPAGRAGAVGDRADQRRPAHGRRDRPPLSDDRAAGRRGRASTCAGGVRARRRARAGRASTGDRRPSFRSRAGLRWRRFPTPRQWARRFTQGMRTTPKDFLSRGAPNTVCHAVAGIAQACVPDPDAMLHDLLAATIADCEARIRSEPFPVSMPISRRLHNTRR